MGIKDVFAGIKNPVEANYQLTSCSVGSSNAVYSNCHMNGVVTGPGIGPVAVEHAAMAPTAKWPQPGETLPVTVDRDNPNKLRVRWDDVVRNRDLGRQLAQQQAAQLAAQMASGQPAGGQGAGSQPAGGQQPTSTTGVVGDPGRAVPGVSGGGLTPEQAAAALAGQAGGMQQATARVLAVHDVALPAGSAAAPGGLVDLTLDVTPQSGPGYSTRMRIAFSTAEKRARVAAVGRELPVLINPASQDQIVVDANRL